MRIFQPTVTGSNTTTGSLHISGPVHFYTLDDTTVSYVLTYDTESGQVYYTASSQVGTSTNPAPSDTYVQYNSGGLFSASPYFRFIYSSSSLEQGGTNTALGQFSHAEGGFTTALGTYSHTEGISTYTGFVNAYSASISSGVVTLWDTYPDLSGNFLPGDYIVYKGIGSAPYIAVVDSATYSSPNTIITLTDLSINAASTIIGNANKNVTSWTGDQTSPSGFGFGSHAEGTFTYALGVISHAEGRDTATFKEGSNTKGKGTVSIGDYQLVIGTYNALNTSSYSFIIGDGTTDNDRHNVLFVSKSHFEVSASNTYLQGLPEVSSNYIITYDTASGQVHYALSTALETSPFPFTGSAGVTGSIELTGSMFTSGAISASFGPNTVGFYGTASWAQSASFAATAAAAPLDTYIQYNKNGVLGAEQHFRYIYSSHSLQNGYNTTASGQYSHAEGFNTIATGSYQTVVGQYNIALPSQSAFIIGDGYIAPLETEKLTSFIAAGANNFSEAFGKTPEIGMFIIFTDVSTGISETFEITKVTNIGGGNYGIDFNGNTTQTYSNFTNDTYSLATYRRHNLLFASRSWFDVSASSVFLRGIPTSSEANILVYNNSTGQVYYTASNALITSPFPYTGSAGITGSIRLTGSMFVSGAISASFGENTVGFYGTASWAQSASFAATAAAAPSDTFIQYNKEGLFGATGSFRFIYTSQSFQQGYNVVASGDYSHAQGSGSTASGAASHAEGWKNIASGDYSHAEGEGNKVLGNGSHVEGRINYISESSRWSHVGGLQNSASGWYQTVFGQNNKPILSQSAFIIGGDSYSFPPSVRWNMFVAVPKTILIDPENSATPSDAIIEMKADTASISASHLFMWGFSSSNSTTRLADSVLTYNSITGQVFYTASNTIGGNSTPAPSDTYIQYNENNTFGAEQYFKYIYTSHSLEQGEEVTAFGFYSHAQGSGSLASGSYSHAEGLETWAIGNSSHAEGSSTYASGGSSHTEGFQTITTGQYSHAEGYYTSASGQGSHAEGYYTLAFGDHSHAEGGGDDKGNYLTAYGDFSHAEGLITVASGSYSHAEGTVTIARGPFSHAEGINTIASGSGSHAEGFNTEARGYASHTEGAFTLTIRSGSHAEGFNTTASGLYSHAEGSSSLANGNYSHAEGRATFTKSNYSYAAGYSSSAESEYQHVIGQFNEAKTAAQSAFIIGDGDDNDNRHNVLFVSKSHFEVDAPNVFLKNLPQITQSYVLTYNSSTDKVSYANAPNGYKSYIATFTSIDNNPNVTVYELFNNTGADITWANIGPGNHISISASSNIFNANYTHWLLNTPADSIASPRISFISRSNDSELCIKIPGGSPNYSIGFSPSVWGNIEIKIFPEPAVRI